MIINSKDAVLSPTSSILAQRMHEYPNNIISFMARKTAQALEAEGIRMYRSGACYTESFQPIPDTKTTFHRDDNNAFLFGLYIDHDLEPILLL